MISLFFAVAAWAEFDLFEANTKLPARTMVFVHGGAWISGDKSEYKKLGERFAGAGLCVVNVNYPLAPAHPHPAATEALQDTLRELSKRKSPSCDFTQLILAGHSAGAHTIAYWAAKYSDPSVKGFIGIEGIYDLPKLAKKWPTYPEWFLKKAFPEGWKEASPSRLVQKTKSPWLVIHSEKDELVDLAQSTEFLEHLRAQKIASQMVKIDKGSHDSVIQNFGLNSEPATREALEFVRKLP